MVNSVQSVQNKAINLNKIGFTAKKGNKQAFEASKDEFSKSHAVRNGAAIGAVAGLGVITASIVELKKLGSTQSISELLKQNKTRAGTWFVGLMAVGAGISTVVKHFKETPKDEFVKKESHAVRNGAIAGAVVALARISYLQIKGSQISNLYKKISTVNKPIAIVGIAEGLAVCTGISAAIGAGIGKIVKHFSKKD